MQMERANPSEVKKALDLEACSLLSAVSCPQASVGEALPHAPAPTCAVPCASSSLQAVTQMDGSVGLALRALFSTLRAFWYVSSRASASHSSTAWDRGGGERV